MRILHILGDRRLPRDPDQEAASGIVNVALETALAQTRIGHEVWVASVGDDAWDTVWHDIKLVQMRRLNWAKIKLPGRRLQFDIHLPYVLLARSVSFDLIVGNSHYYMRFLKAPVRFVNIQTPPYYMTDDGDSLARTRRDMHGIARFTDAQLTASKFIATQVRDALGSAGNVHVVYNGINVERFAEDSQSESRRTLRQAWQMEPNDLALLFAGAIVQEKGVVHLARAYCDLMQHNQNLHLVIAGGSIWKDAQIDYQAKAEAILLTAENGDHIHQLGSVSRTQMPSVYAACDIVIIPSIWPDPFPLVALEALAAGRPIIASRVGGIPESVSEDCGILVPPGDEPSLKNAILRLVADPQLRAKMSEAARQRAHQFSWQEAANQISSIYMAVRT